MQQVTVSCKVILMCTYLIGRSQWPRGLRRRSAAACLLRLFGSNPTGALDICLLWVSCVVRKRSLRRADLLSRGVLPKVVRRCVWSRNLVNEEILTHSHTVTAVNSCFRSWWWVEVPPETCRAVSRYNKLCNVASCLIYIRIFLRCTDLWKLKNLIILSFYKHKLKAYKSGGITPFILNFVTAWKPVISLTLLPLYSRGACKRVRGLQNHSELLEKKRQL
jgi:hypothetical protein